MFWVASTVRKYGQCGPGIYPAFPAFHTPITVNVPASEGEGVEAEVFRVRTPSRCTMHPLSQPIHIC